MIGKREFVKELSKKTGFMQKDVAAVMQGAGELICEYAKQHEVVKPMDGFIFEGKVSDAREGRNPKTGETIKIPAKNKITCRFSKTLKDAIQ